MAKGGGYVIGAVGRGKRVYKSCCGGITVLRLGALCRLLFFNLCSSGCQDLLRLTSFPVDVIGMHLNFNGFSDEAVHVTGFCGENFCLVV